MRFFDDDDIGTISDRANGNRHRGENTVIIFSRKFQYIFVIFFNSILNYLKYSINVITILQTIFELLRRVRVLRSWKTTCS